MLYVKQFGSFKELELFLQDKIVGGKLFDAAEHINVRNLTLTFTTPGVTITFPNTAAFEMVTVAEIQIEAEGQSSGRVIIGKPPGDSGRKFRFLLPTDGDVFTGGTAAPVMGLPPSPGPYTVGANKLAVADVASTPYIDGRSIGLVYDA